MDIFNASNIQTAAEWITFFYGLTFHECAHALTAFWLGDDTAKNEGRVTLNPLVHIDPIGLISLVIFGIGWAKPVIMNPFNFRYPKFYSVLTALAGPLSNFILALISMYGIQYIYAPFFHASSTMVGTAVFAFFVMGMEVNIFLGVFNMLPIAPFDGSHMIMALLPEGWKATYRHFSYFLCILILVFYSKELHYVLDYGTDEMRDLLVKFVI